MIVASRPADLLPSSDFWYEMARADVLDLRILDPMRGRGLERMARMRGRWTTVPIVAGPAGSPMSGARILPAETPRALAAAVTERYRDTRHWQCCGPQVLDVIDGVRTDSLWQFNLHLILGIRRLLGITTPVSVSRRPMSRGGAGVASIMAAHRATTFLSGTAGRAYVTGDDSYLTRGIDIVWSAHRPVTTDSILTIMMDHDDPMAVVLAEVAVPAGRPSASDAQRPAWG